LTKTFSVIKEITQVPLFRSQWSNESQRTVWLKNKCETDYNYMLLFPPNWQK